MTRLDRKIVVGNERAKENSLFLREKELGAQKRQTERFNIIQSLIAIK